MNDKYQDLILKVSNEIAMEFMNKEEKLISGALLLDADIAEITREIGLKTTSIVLENSCDELVKKNDWKA
jgi:hypothetical protein